MKTYSKILTLFLIFSGIYLQAFSQSESDTASKTHSYEICLGYCKPTGEFQYSPIAENKGYALPGVSLFVSAKNPINKFLGFKYAMAVFVNKADRSIFYAVDSVNTSLNVGMWSNLNLGVGTFVFSENENTRIEAGFNIGLLILNRPNVSYRTYDNGSVVSSDEIKKGLGFGFSIIPEVAVIQKLSNEASLKFFINYMFAPSYVEYKKQHYFVNTEDEYIWSVMEYTDRLQVSVLSAGIGVIF